MSNACRFRCRSGFTLIELLIVVAIIAILAAIALPNFLDAQIRAKVSRTKADFRALTTAFETYRVDNNAYPPDIGDSWANDVRALAMLSTPVGYITAVPDGVFRGARGAVLGLSNYSYWGYNPDRPADAQPQVSYRHGIYYHVTSVGPSLHNDMACSGEEFHEAVVRRDGLFLDLLYDPTNGSVSLGDLHMTNRGLSN